jgi:membrane protease YdiL (CAAX protease family)
VLGSVAAAGVIALGEEIGWTGFAVPRLRRRYGTLATGLVVGVLWGLWHGPLFWSAARAEDPEAWPVVLTVMLFSFLPPFRVLLVWAHDRTESLLIAVLMHTGLAATTLVLQLLGRGIPTVSYDLAFAAGLWAIAAGAMVASVRRPARRAPARIGAAAVPRS